jgi:inner membrane protein
MDSITQFVLGAAVGEVTLKRVRLAETAEQGGKPFRAGPFWLGGLVGTLPDLDVFFRKYLTGPQALGFHRGVTHSIFFCTLITPLLAWILSRLFRRYDVSWKQWNVFVWLGLNTHWMIDSLTTYGTQVFLPFSNYPVNIGSVFIIDPVYTLALLAGVLWTLFVSRGARPYRPRGAQAGLVFSTVYLLLTLGSKYAVLARFESSAREQGLPYRQMISVATPFNSILWYGYADTGEDVWVADSSLLDPLDRPIVWQRISKGHDTVKNFGEGVADRRLLWFSRGFYRLDRVDGQPIFIDLRFSRLKSWFLPIAPEGDDYIFRFALKPSSDQGPFDDFRRLRPAGGMQQFPWDIFWRRVLGQDANSLAGNVKDD